MFNLILIVTTGIYGGAGGYTIGYAKMYNRSINSKMVEYGLLEINGLLLNGGSGYAFINRIIIGGSGYGGSVRETGDSLSVKYGVGGGYFEIGYMPLSIKSLFPVVIMGIGGYSEELVIGNVQRRSDWNGVWQYFQNETRITRGGFSLSPSIGFIFYPQKFPLGFMFVATYNTILSKTWKFDSGTELSDNPDVPIGGFSFKITILTGGVKYGK